MTENPADSERRYRQSPGGLAEIFSNLGSSDRPTRRMAWVFFVSFLGVLFVFSAMVVRYRRYREATMQGLSRAGTGAKHLSDFIRRQADEARHKSTTLSLGSFAIEVKEVPGQRRAPGVMSVAEVELVLQCDSKDARYYIEDHMPQARNQVTNVLLPVDRADLLSRDGKRRLKREIIEHLNAWLPAGKVEELYISKLIVN